MLKEFMVIEDVFGLAIVITVVSFYYHGSILINPRKACKIEDTEKSFYTKKIAQYIWYKA